MSARDHSYAFEAEPSPTAAGELGPPLGRDVSLLAIFNVLIRHRWLILGTALLLAAAVGVATVRRPRTYTVSATLMPQETERRNTSLTGLAAQFGVSLGGNSADQSPAFYANLLRSRVVLNDVVDASYNISTENGPKRGTLPALLNVRASTPDRRKELARRWLRANVDVATVRETGLVQVSVKTPWRDLSLEITNRMLALIDTFNRERRRTQAAAERAFVEARVVESRQNLQQAEMALEQFLQRNREFRNAPQLMFGHDRLRRDVDMHQAMYTTLRQAYEQARIDEVRNTPVVTVVEPPELPAYPDSRLLLVKVLLAFLVGIAVGAAVAFARTGARAVEGREQDRREFEQLSRAAITDLQRPWRAVRRLVRSA
jgi:uncharacterized protein involved in exopolysaccharide biosynthesis